MEGFVELFEDAMIYLSDSVNLATVSAIVQVVGIAVLFVTAIIDVFSRKVALRVKRYILPMCIAFTLTSLMLAVTDIAYGRKAYGGYVLATIYHFAYLGMTFVFYVIIGVQRKRAEKTVRREKKLISDAKDDMILKSNIKKYFENKDVKTETIKCVKTPPTIDVNVDFVRSVISTAKLKNLTFSERQTVHDLEFLLSTKGIKDFTLSDKQRMVDGVLKLCKLFESF